MTWTNEEIKSGMKKLVACDRENLVLFLRYLIELESRELFLEEGASTVHDYLERFLGLSHGTTLKRIWVSRAATRFPVLLDFLGSGQLNLTSLSFLVKHLTEDNHRFLLSGAVGKKETELRWWLATLFPEPLPPDWQLNGKEKIIPLDGETGKFILVVDREFLEQLNRSKEVHKHRFPDGNTLGILKHAMKEDLKHNDPKEKIKRTRPTKITSNNPKPKIQTRRIPAGIEKAVRERDNHQCTFVSKEGIRCSEKGGVETDHIQPWAMGGRSDDINNLRLLCFSYNRHKGRLDFGKDFRVT
jgi:HNH endonuclease